MVSISSDVIRGYNDTIILYLLLEAPSYGYEISKQIKNLSEESKQELRQILKEKTLLDKYSEDNLTVDKFKLV